MAVTWWSPLVVGMLSPRDHSPLCPRGRPRHRVTAGLPRDAGASQSLTRQAANGAYDLPPPGVPRRRRTVRGAASLLRGRRPVRAGDARRRLQRPLRPRPRDRLRDIPGSRRGRRFVTYADYLAGEPVILTAALTRGVHGKEANPNLPETPEEIGRSAAAAEEAGAAVVHVHAREDNGERSFATERFQAVDDAIREHADDVIIQHSTGGTGAPDELRHQPLRTDPAPEMA